MSNVFEFVAEGRGESGKSSARTVRRGGRIPAIIYGGNSAPEMLSLKHSDVIKNLEHEAVYSHVLEVTIGGKTEQAILKDIQRHPSKPQIMHMDFLRVSATDKLRVNVPMHFVNESGSVGVKKGGVVMHSLVDIEVSCLPADLPEYIELDLSALDIGESIHLSDIKLPEGVEIIALMQEGGHDLSVVSIVQAKGGAADEDEGEDAAEVEETE